MNNSILYQYTKLNFNILILFFSLLILGIFIRPLERKIWLDLNSQGIDLSVKKTNQPLSTGLVVGMLGGLRNLVADIIWIKNSIYWEKSNLPATETFIYLTTDLVPESLYFWINGARIISYDMSNWRLKLIGRVENIPKLTKQSIWDEQAKDGIKFLEKALLFHPNEPLIYIEIASMYINRLDDKLMGAKYYRMASEKNGAPYYVSRIYPEILRQIGEKRKALIWYRNLYPKLPANNPLAHKDVVLQRINDLETELSIK